MTDMAWICSNLTWQYLVVVYLLSISAASGQGEKTEMVVKGQANQAALLTCACSIAIDGCDPEDLTQTCKEPEDLCMIIKAGNTTIAGCAKPDFCNMEDETITCCNTTLCNTEFKGCQTQASPSKITNNFLADVDDKTGSDFITTRTTREAKPSKSSPFWRTAFSKLTTNPPSTSTANRKTPSTFCTLVFIACTIAFTYSQFW